MCSEIDLLRNCFKYLDFMPFSVTLQKFSSPDIFYILVSSCIDNHMNMA